MSAISVRNIVKRFDDFLAVRDVSFDVQEGEFVTLLGPSGCGKTTLLNLMSGFLTPTSGRIEIAGKDITLTPPERRDTAMCFQSYALFPHLSVAENLLFGLKQKKCPRAEREHRLSDVSSKLDLDAQLGKLPNQLSGGQQQRVALGRALAMRPKVVLFDEPLSNLDAKLRDSVRLEIREIQRAYNLSAIYVTHDQGEALAMSDRIIVMKAGQIEQSGPPDEIYNAPKTSFVADFIGAANIVPAQVLAQEAPDRWRLRSAIGEVLVQSQQAPVGPEINLCWRPENARPGPGEVNSFTAELRDRAFQGNYTDLYITVKGQQQRLQWREEVRAVGTQVDFHIRPQDFIFLEARSNTDRAASANADRL